MLNGIDISSWQGDIDLAALGLDFAIMKATEGTDYVNPYCDPKVEQAKSLGLKWGFYHFATGGDAVAEADYFVDNCANYFGNGIPVLDFEADAISRGAGWAKAFLDRVYERTGIRALIYMSQSVTVQYDWSAVAANHGLWVAMYPNVLHPGFEYDADFTASTGAWDFVAIWQYCSDGRLPGYSSNLDLNHAYMTRESWDKYSGAYKPANNDNGGDVIVVQNDDYIVEVKRK